MNATIPMILVSTVAAGLAQQGAARQADPPEIDSRRPVDVSVEGLGARQERRFSRGWIGSER